MIKSNARFWIALGIFLISLVTWIIYRDDVFQRIAIFVGLIVIGSYIWAFFSTLGLDVERSTKVSRQKVGEYFEENFKLINKSSIWHFNLHVKDGSVLDGYLSSKVISYLGSKQIRSFNTFTLLKERGAILLGPTIIESYDPLKFFNSKKENKKNISLLIYPYTVDINRFPEPPGLLTGGKSLKKSTMEATPHAAGIHEYSPGDPLQRIHWPSTLRKNRYMVKEFDQDPQSSIWIFLDSFADNHLNLKTQSDELINPLDWAIRKKGIYKLPRDTYEYAISIAASIANYYIKQGRSTGFSSVGRTLTHLSAEKGHRQLSKILETLAFLKPDGNLPLLGLIQAETKNLSRGTTIILITTTIENKIEECSEFMRQRGFFPIFIIIENNSFINIEDIQSNEDIMLKLNSPCANVKYGDDLVNVLESI